MSQSSTEIIQPSPGPWTVDAQSSLPRVIGPDRVIAAVVSGNGPGSSREVALKDAQLLAAALDMYEAGNALLQELLTSAPSTMYPTEIQAAMHTWQLATDKAEGRAES